MRTLGFLPVVVAGIMMSLFVSCSKDPRTNELEADVLSNASSEMEEVVMLRSAVEALDEVDEVALDYCNNAKTIMYATEAFERPSTFVSYEDMDDNYEQSSENPVSLKLQSLDIVDDGTGDGVNFYDLPLDQKQIFADMLLVEEAKAISEKMDEIPGLREIVRNENIATQRVIERNNFDEKRVSYIDLNALRSGASGEVDVKKFFQELTQEIALQHESEGNVPTLRGGEISFSYPIVDVSKVRSAWAKYSRRGDFVLALPVHGRPWNYFNIGKNVKFSVGHAGIIAQNITESTLKTKKGSTIECWKKSGVEEESISLWNTPHYIMGIQKVKWVWRWRGFRSGLYKETYPVSNPGALADWAARYKGLEYVKWYEFMTAKWFAPKRFTCTTLVWWCAKKAYGINVSGWYTPLVTPSGLLLDSSTYVRHEIKN